MKQRSRIYQSADICIVWAGKYVLKFWQESLTFQKEEHTVLLFNVYQIIRAELKKNPCKCKSRNCVRSGTYINSETKHITKVNINLIQVFVLQYYYFLH